MHTPMDRLEVRGSSRATERHERLKRRKAMKRTLREIERRLREGCYDEDDWLDDETNFTQPSPSVCR